MFRCCCDSCAFLNGNMTNGTKLEDKAENYCQYYQQRVNEDGICVEYKKAGVYTEQEKREREKKEDKWIDTIEKIKKIDDFHLWPQRSVSREKPPLGVSSLGALRPPWRPPKKIYELDTGIKQF